MGVGVGVGVGTTGVGEGMDVGVGVGGWVRIILPIWLHPIAKPINSSGIIKNKRFFIGIY